MRLYPLPRSVALLALGFALARSGCAAGPRDTSATNTRAALELAMPKDVFSEFIREGRSLEDTLHFREGEAATGQEEFDLALSHHLAAAIPASGKFRDELLAQRSRIFARLWPSAASSFSGGRLSPQEENLPRGLAFDWGMGGEHSGGMDREAPRFPFAANGSGRENRDWRYLTFARLGGPVSLGGRTLNLGLSANADRSSLGGASTYEAALQAEMPEGLLQDALLSVASGVGKSRDWGSHRYYGLVASKAWYSENGETGFEAGYSGQWSSGWKRMRDFTWAKASRDFPFLAGNGFQASLEASATRQASWTESYSVPVLDANAAVPSAAGITAGAPSLAGEKILTLEAPQSFFSLSPAVEYAITLPAAVQARALARYTLEIYPEYAWDRITWSDSLDANSLASAGLALRRSEGRYYPALLVEQEGGYREYTGTAPLEHFRKRRADNRAGLDFKFGKDLPQGYFLSLESSLDVSWTNLPGSAPAAFQPWRWGLSVNVSRSVSGLFDQFI